MQRLVIEPQQQQAEIITLTSQQDHYLRRVLRLGEGDRFIALDGKGQGWIAALSAGMANIIEPISQHSSELALNVTLIVALPKSQGFDEIVRCCTELGVTTFLPVISHRTFLQPSPKKVERWRRIAKEAAEQSERLMVPKILDPVPFSQGLSQSALTSQRRYICVARGKNPLLLSCLQSSPQAEITIATGPEGGWNGEEIQTAIALGFQPISLGQRILRAVTAPIVVLSLIAAVAES